ncbi:MAG TPA: hypothetical protein VJL29_05175, partial [Thermoguttaceae bacterium]|nr:hypothetical protein [Thermoguttaceae bacterium]
MSVLPDTRTHEIIVLAPPAVHDRIAAQLAPPRASATEPMPAHHSPPMPVQARQTSPPSPPTPSQASPAPVRQNVNLWNVSAAEFEANLLRAADGQLQSRSAADGAREYLLPVAGGDSPRLRVEP